MKFFCSHPFTSLVIRHNHVVPCCVFKNTSGETIDTYFKSDSIKKVKSQLLQNIAPIECNNCVKNEAATNNSFRIHKELYDSNEESIRSSSNPVEYFDIQDLQIVTSNICNLLCLPCESSSYIRQLEFKNLGMKVIPAVYRLPNINDKLALFPNLNTLTITGGEPFADKIAMDIIDHLIDSNRSQKIRLDLNTNLTLVTKDILIKLKDNFKEVLIKGSIDGVGDYNNYLRYPSTWQQITTATELIHNLNIPFIITTAMSNLALLQYDKIVEWASMYNIEHLVMSAVTTPDVLNCSRLPATIKEKLLIKYTNLLNLEKFSERTTDVINACIAMCSTPGCSEEEFKQTIDWLNKHDQHRGTNFREVWPELNDF